MVGDCEEFMEIKSIQSVNFVATTVFIVCELTKRITVAKLFILK